MRQMRLRLPHLIRAALVALAAAVLASVALAQVMRYRIVVEAEHYNVLQASMRVVSGDCKASGGKYVEYPLKRPHAASENPAVKGDGGHATYKVRIPARGQYLVWIRRWWQDGCGNSFFLSVDGGSPQTIQDATYQVWKWTKATQAYSLSAGVHTFKLQNREDGARCDQILITNDARFSPVRAMPETADYLVK